VAFLTREPGDDLRERHCPHRGELCRLAHGYVYRVDDARAVDNVALYARHPDRCALFQLAVGDEWPDEADPRTRLAVALEFSDSVLTIDPAEKLGLAWYWGHLS
jgi:hypothetical protein